MRLIIFLSLLFLTQYVLFGQGLLKCDDAYLSIVSEAPLELISAESDRCEGVLNLELGQFAFRLKVRSLEGFNSPLQREHFNENYMESETYPNAIFKGRFLEQLDLTAKQAKVYEVIGDLEVHGVTEEYAINVILSMDDDGSLSFEAEFQVELATHNIDVPRIVYQKIADVIDVNVKGVLR